MKKLVVEEHLTINTYKSHSDSLTISSEESLLAWLNNELSIMGVQRIVKNFGKDLSDSLVIAYLLNNTTKIFTGKTYLDLPSLMRQLNLTKRAEIVIDSSKRIGCNFFVNSGDIVNVNERMIMAFIAVLHNTRVQELKPVAFLKVIQNSVDSSSPSTAITHSPLSPMSNLNKMIFFYSLSR